MGRRSYAANTSAREVSRHAIGLHFIISLLCHDIGYVRGVCRGDGNGRYVYDDKGELVTLPDGSTDASLTPYHVTRSKLFVRERFGKIALTHVYTM